MKSMISVALVAIVSMTCACAFADVAGYYFNVSSELIDLTFPGDTFYGEVVLGLLGANQLAVNVNPFTAPSETDYLGNVINSPLLAGANFGIQAFSMGSALIATQNDFNTFLSLYDIEVPNNWGFSFDGQVSEFGRFDFVYEGTGSSRADPLAILITPKTGADLTGYEFDSVMTFVEPNADGYSFAAHIAGFTVDSSWWEPGSSNPESAYFAVTPEPSVMTAAGFIALWMLKRKRA